MDFDIDKKSSVPNNVKISKDLFDRYLGAGSLWTKSVREGINSYIQKSPPSLLWHYCSAETFEKVCNSGHIFLGDLDSMNDYQEGRWLRDQIGRRVSSSAQEFIPYLEATRIRFHLGPFVTSLSEDGDLLSQWRAYANGGRGTALGLSPEKLSIPIFQIDREQLSGYTALCNVIYDTDLQEALADAVASIINSIVSEMQGKYFPPEAHPYIFCAAHINMNLHYIEPLFKNPAFREEKEWRIIRFPKSSLMNTWKAPSDVRLSDETEVTTLRFRTTLDDIVPYFVFPEDNTLGRMIKGITLGPLNRMRDHPLALFLSKSGLSDYVIRRSSATLR
ncbi:MAG: DUF2971 domain-containing protein [Acetobacter sp.]|uniref:DUF2971 domain-containing protein n=1 Tax=Acetobacter sp. TaxID=440 RepID=UPI003CFE0221